MSRFQPIYDIAVLCAKKNLTDAVLCPGSRCAPLTLAFTRHPDIKCRTISDERSAAFIALGIAQQIKRPCILVSTSGTAVYNFAPAVAEAYFSKRPIIVLTADRPTEWVGQQDGQTIYQSDIFGKHVKRSYQLPQEYEHPDNGWAINRIVNEALNLAQQEPQGPVHINIPFREPLYPRQGETFSFSDDVRTITDQVASPLLDDVQQSFIASAWSTYERVLIVSGQQDWTETALSSVSTFLAQHHVPLLGDVISNLHGDQNILRHADLILGSMSDDIKATLQPDLLITIGESTIAKNVKVFLRKYQATAHWHIQSAGDIADTYQSVTQIFRTSAADFFSMLTPLFNHEVSQKRITYTKRWQTQEKRIRKTLEHFLSQSTFGEIHFVNAVMRGLPNSCNLHLANSMSVRYASMIGLMSDQRNVKIFSNRGTSGIDGCTSTCVGNTLSGDDLNILITGDLAFFYDRNAFWHNYAMPNLRVIILNNHGGIIFKMIDGPGDAPEADEYFITKQKLSARHLCAEFGIEYHAVRDSQTAAASLQTFFDDAPTPKIMEFESDVNTNKLLLDELKRKIRKDYES